MMRRIYLLAVGFMLSAGGALAAPPLYVDKIEQGDGEIDVTYSYVSRFPPDPDDVLQVARAQCRRLGFVKAARSSDPTLRRCIAVNIYGGCNRETATDNFICSN